MTEETIEISKSLVLNYELNSKKVYCVTLQETVEDRQPRKITMSEEESLRLIEALAQMIRHMCNLQRKSIGKQTGG